MLKDKIYRFILNQNINMDYDVFAYGYYVVMTYCLYLSVIIPISIIHHTFFETVLFIMVFVSLRQYLGGIHFNSSFVCFIVSIIVAIIIPLISSKIGNVTIYVRLLIIVISFLCVNLVGPVDNINKRLSIKEKNYFLIKANKILSIYLIYEIFLYSIFLIEYGNTILFTIFVMNISLILPVIFDYFKIKLNKDRN